MGISCNINIDKIPLPTTSYSSPPHLTLLCFSSFCCAWGFLWKCFACILKAYFRAGTKIKVRSGEEPLISNEQSQEITQE